MRALLVYTYTDYHDNEKIKVGNKIIKIDKNGLSYSDILNIQKELSYYPCCCDPRVVNVINIRE